MVHQRINAAEYLDAGGSLQEAINELLISGGTLFFPPGEYRIPDEGLKILTGGLYWVTHGADFGITFEGSGMYWGTPKPRGRELTEGEKLIKYGQGGTTLIYRGFGNAIIIGDNNNPQHPSLGITIRNLAILGTDNADAGILFKHAPPLENNPNPVANRGTGPYRCSVENVSVFGFNYSATSAEDQKTGAGIRIEWIATSVFRNVHVLNNRKGIDIESCINFLMDRIVARGNFYGVFIGGKNSLGPVSNITITGQSLIESNEAEGLVLESPDIGGAANLAIEHTRFEANNGSSVGTRRQLSITANTANLDIPPSFDSLLLSNVTFAGDPGYGADGDIYLNLVRSVLMQNLRSDTEDRDFITLEPTAVDISMWNISAPNINGAIVNGGGRDNILFSCNENNNSQVRIRNLVQL